jgi:hypothetical protein
MLELSFTWFLTRMYGSAVWCKRFRRSLIRSYINVSAL